MSIFEWASCHSSLVYLLCELGSWAKTPDSKKWKVSNFDKHMEYYRVLRDREHRGRGDIIIKTSGDPKKMEQLWSDGLKQLVKDVRFSNCCTATLSTLRMRSLSLSLSLALSLSLLPVMQSNFLMALTQHVPLTTAASYRQFCTVFGGCTVGNAVFIVYAASIGELKRVDTPTQSFLVFLCLVDPLSLSLFFLSC